MRCWRIRRQLGEYLDGHLPPSGSGQVATHLHACARCRAELAQLERSIRALEQLPLPGVRMAARASARTLAPDPDALWAGLQARLQEAPAAGPDEHAGRRMRCGRVEAWLPAYLEAALPARAQQAVADHLAGCGRCAADEGDLRRSLALLDAMTPARPDRDLWPELAARLAPAGPAPAARRQRAAWQAGGLLAGLGAAALALALFRPAPGSAPAVVVPDQLPVPIASNHPAAPDQVAPPAPTTIHRPTSTAGKSDPARPPGRRHRPRLARAVPAAPRAHRAAPVARRPAGPPREQRERPPARELFVFRSPAVPAPMVLVSQESPEALREVAASLAPMGEDLQMSPSVGELLTPGEERSGTPR